MNNPKELLERNFPTADQDARRASRPSLYAGDDSSYELAFTDNDFLLHPDLRPVRLFRRCQGAVPVPELPAAQMAVHMNRLTGPHGREAPRRS